MRTGLSCSALRFASAATIGRLLLLLLLVARAWVPVGYMPDAGALKLGRLALQFCAAGGGSFMGLRAMANSAPHADPHHGHHGHGGQPAESGAGQECPFGLSAHQVLHLPPVLALAPILLRWFAQAPLLVDTPSPPMPAAGPPLGQRAPPRNLG